MKSISLVSFALIGLLTQPPCACGELFKDGETVCLLGDSITARGATQTILSDYYLTRFPDRTVRFVNAGRSGDNAGGALGRLQEDVIAKKPTSVSIMFGMNDVNRGAYVSNSDDAKKSQQQQALNGYKANMENLIARIRTEAGDAKLYLVTPSPFDQTVVLEKENNQPGCNDGLGRCAEFVREMAQRNRAALVDFHAPMTALNLEQQTKDPKWTIVGGDRVHPSAPGHLMMAWLFLKAQGAPSLISKITVDAAGGHAAECMNAEVSGVEKKSGGVVFTVREKALPFPIDPAAKPLLELLPIKKDLAEEMLSVTGLADGHYEVRIDGAPVGRFTAADLALGINLAFNEATPQFKQAQEVRGHNEQRRNAEAQACSLMNTRRWMQSRYKVNVDDPIAVQSHYDHFEDKKEYNAGMALNYIKNWPRYEELLQQVAAHEKNALSGRVLVSHLYAVAPVAAGK